MKQDDRDCTVILVKVESALLNTATSWRDQSFQAEVIPSLPLLSAGERVWHLLTVCSCVSQFQHRLVVKTVLKLLLVFVEYTENNAVLLIQAANIVDDKRCKCYFKGFRENYS